MNDIVKEWIGIFKEHGITKADCKSDNVIVVHTSNLPFVFDNQAHNESATARYIIFIPTTSRLVIWKGDKEWLEIEEGLPD